MGYTAFISYSHEDEKFARSFHRKLESWNIPKDLIGQKTKNCIIPDTLRPIFRDRDDFAGGSSLKKATLKALNESNFLIVLCSPHAAASKNVIEEVRLFKKMGHADKIIPVIIGGEPNNSENECFPSSIKYVVSKGGLITHEEAEPIAADARDIGDGKHRAFSKVVAGILGVSFDVIYRRALRARRNRNAMLIGISLGALVFAATFASFALYKNYQSNITIEKSVFAIGGLIRETDRLGGNDITQKRSEMLRLQCDLLEALSQHPQQIGLIERTICLTQQAQSVYDIGEKTKR